MASEMEPRKAEPDLVKISEGVQRREAIISPRRMKTDGLDMQPQTTELFCYLWHYQNESETDDHQWIVLWIIPYLSPKKLRPVWKIILLQVTCMTPKPPHGHMKLWRNEKYTSTIFFMLKFCLYLLFDWYFASTQPFRSLKYQLTCAFFTVHIWEELTWHWQWLCMVTISIEWLLNHVYIW